MISWWLIMVGIISLILIVGVVIYLVLLFQAEEDRSQAWFPKVVVISGLSLACINVLLLPYDVANKQDTQKFGSQGGGLDTVLAWQIVLYCIAIFIFFLLPFAMMYYEAMDPEQTSVLSQIKPALIYTTIGIVIFAILLFTLWLTVGTAVIPYSSYTSEPVMHNPIPEIGPNGERIIAYVGKTKNDVLEIKVSFFVYLVSLLSACGWLLLMVFGGVGLSAFPIDFIRDFIDRPKPISASEYALKRSEIAQESERLIAIGSKLDEVDEKTKYSRKHMKKLAAFKQQVTELEAYYKKLEVCYREHGGKLLVAILKLILGIFGAILSFMWFLHIILYDAAKVTPFLNNMFVALDGAFRLFGIAAYGIFAFYLLWCVVKGCTKVGVNLLLFTVYPMEVNNTLMNAFCFNTLLILISSVTVVQFCAISFDIYASNTSVNTLFTTYASRLKGIGYILTYFFYPMLVITLVSLLWLFICPRRKVDVDE